MLSADCIRRSCSLWSHSQIELYATVVNLVVPSVTGQYENLYSPHNSDSSSDKIDTKLYNKDTKNKLN